jgi:TetR/AcrR family transcriptional regulator, transcriptional repressor for nem operon
MPRTKTYNLDTLIDASLRQFWAFGYSATSMDDIVRVTGVNRHGIYAEFGGKRGLFLACVARYRQQVVDIAFQRVETAGSTIDEIAAYFEFQIARAELAGLPGPGCLFANSATENAPHDSGIKSLVLAHNKRLQDGFSDALLRSVSDRGRFGKRRADTLAASVVAFANGLWTQSRLTDDASQLRSTVAAFLELLKETLKNDHGRTA